MALVKTIEGETGASAQYWKVIEVNLNYFANVGAVALAGYVSKAARQAGKRPLDARQFPIQGDAMAAFQAAALEGDGKNPVKAAYAFIKTYVPQQPQGPQGQPAPVNPFADAVDDI